MTRAMWISVPRGSRAEVKQTEARSGRDMIATRDDESTALGSGQKASRTKQK